MNTSSAARFHALHHQPLPLRLPNAWDAGSARQIEMLGAQAIATTSAGVAWSLGYRDGNQLPVAEYVARAASIARVINVPLSADIEGGYHEHPATVADTVRRMIDVGVVGINIEDGSADPQWLCHKVEAIKAASISAGVELYINVRTDVYARNLVPAGDRAGEVILRAQNYRHAGADGLFVLGLVEAQEMQAIAKSSDLLLNVSIWPGLPPLDDLSEYGVRRISVGSWLPQTLWAHNEQLVRGFLSDNETAPLMATATPYSAINALF